MILENTIKQASQILKKNSINSHELDAELILSNLMGIKRESLILNNFKNISNNIKYKYDSAIRRRIKREPVAYILERKEFWSQNFVVNQATLIPRPETELMIYKLIKFFKNKKINILDIGTGSGCILLSILKELNSSRGTGIDISSKAIKIAKINSKKLNLSYRAKFKVFDINKFDINKYDLIVSNPPYIPTRDIKNLSKDIINYEPLIALNGGHDGLRLIKKVIYRASNLLKKNGLLAIEIGYGQYRKASNLLYKHGFIETCKEYDNNRNVRCIISTKIKFL
ncbi:MAG TPA: peptide chain release factor N(5)-glutamine methyltransferase [Candidatus Pelagibacter sp.]|jgi:release factor glutamine methyltransferase|nr:peptide chain release factor N(5)-glutamine methyltransferase [Candidatus Pelagibacter sp.]